MKTCKHLLIFIIFICNQTGAFSLLIFVVNSVFIHSNFVACKANFEPVENVKKKKAIL